MYQVQNLGKVLQSLRVAGRPRATVSVSRTVLLLGITSLLTDVSAEMVTVVLPVYLIATVGLAPLQFGLIDGIYQGGSLLVPPISGFLADRWRRPKLIAVSGYALSAVTKLGLLLWQGAAAVTALVAVDRIGKGIRIAPRDAMIANSSSSDGLGIAFGVHRALDTLGAMIGPLLAFVLLLALPGAFDVVFVVSLCIAIVGVGVIALFVREPAAQTRGAAGDPPVMSVRAAAALLEDRRFRTLVIIGSVLALLTISDAFVYLVLLRRLDFSISFFPLLYVGTSIVYMLLAVPFGFLADRFGRGRLFVAGYAVLAGVYVLLLLPAYGPVQAVLVLALFGAYYAMTEGVLAALASGMLAPDVRASGLGILASATGVARLLSSLAFGIAWTVVDIDAAVAAFLAGLLVAVILAMVVLLRGGRDRLGGPSGSLVG
jgi:MFS family permease